MKDCVRLGMKDGVLDVIFRPRLTNEQFGHLMQACEKLATRADLRAYAATLAIQLGREVDFEEPADA